MDEQNGALGMESEVDERITGEDRRRKEWKERSLKEKSRGKRRGMSGGLGELGCSSGDM